LMMTPRSILISAMGEISRRGDGLEYPMAYPLVRPERGHRTTSPGAA
jgi:hypothetical protein